MYGITQPNRDTTKFSSYALSWRFVAELKGRGTMRGLEDKR